jgi:hypothetical protein
MAVFKQSYPSEQSPDQLWRVINTPLLDPDIVALVHEDFSVSYDGLDEEGLIGLFTTTTYVPTDEARQKVPGLYRGFVPNDVVFDVARISLSYDPNDEVLRHEVLDSGKADGWVTRTVEADADSSKLTVKAELIIDGLGNMFDKQIEQALEHVFGGPSERMIALGSDLLNS